ncbi:uncharacterized protein LOC110815294 [Carica papaya]|uniref:uncharacterized protein LOC110815294 n=1 Tax=Carica papaya TaxID=3649 RepID=UPI000B8D1A06|nr:uncharacterized protein LOC110815294 [Carica papaya]
MALRWSSAFMSYTSGFAWRWLPRTGFTEWNPGRYLRWWPESNVLSMVVDDVMWRVVTAFESVALVSMLCFFFLFCGCTV